MRDTGVPTVLGLPNSTSLTQEQDQLYQDFKGKCIYMTNEAFTSKLTQRSQGIKDIEEELNLENDEVDLENDGVFAEQMITVNGIKYRRTNKKLNNLFI